MSVDKNTVLIAEQVGLFLIPTLRDIAKAQFADAIGSVLSKLSADTLAGVTEARASAETCRAALLAEMSALRTEHSTQVLALEKTLNTLAAQSAELSTAVAAAQVSRDALSARIDTLGVDIRADLRKDHATLCDAAREQVGALADLECRLSEVRELALSSAEGNTVRIEESFSTLKGMVEGVGSALRALEATEPKTVTIKTETDYAAIYAEIGRSVADAVQAIKPPEPVAPDLAPLLDFCRGHISNEVTAAAPALRESLAANVRDEVARAVSGIRLPELDLPGIAEECRSAAATAVAAELPQVRDSLAVNVRDEVTRAVAALPKPKDGEPGPAGLMAAAEPYIEGEVYERLALVSHAGGTWQATRRTKAAPAPNLGDWQAITVGVARVSAQAADDFRTVEVVATLTDGTEFKHAVGIPAMVYRDVYEDSATYEQMDVVTHAGSMWLALKDTQGETPTKAPEAWRLIVKRGQDGRSGKDGADGVQFQAGFEGEYEEKRAYPKNAIVTYSGSTWLAKRPTKERPPYMTNADNEHWLRLR